MAAPKTAPKTAPKCFCTTPLRADGACPHGCDPALRAPGRRRKALEATLTKREKKPTGIGISVKDARRGLAMVCRAYAAELAENRERARRGLLSA